MGFLLVAAFGATASSNAAPRSVLQVQQPETTIVVAGSPYHVGRGKAAVDMTIGRGDDPSEYSFTSVTEVAVGTDGSVFVVDIPSYAQESVNRILLFDRRGRFVRQIGRRGQGPGEYITPQGIHVLSDGTIAVRDNVNGRINTYLKTGESADTWVYGRTGTPANGSALLADTAGFLYLAALSFTPPGFEGLIRFGSHGRVIDSLPFPTLDDAAHRERSQSTIQLRGIRAGSVFGARIPFIASSHSVWSPMGYWVTGYSDRYAFELHVPRKASGPIATPAVTGSRPRPVSHWRLGDPILSIRRSTPALAVLPAERDEQRAIMVARARAAVPNWDWNGAEIPHTKPAYRSLFVGDDGRIWVQLSTVATHVDSASGIQPPRRSPQSSAPVVPVQRWVESNVFDIFEPTGKYIGQVELPRQAQLHVARGDTVWVSRMNSDDVPSVERLHVVWP